MSTTQTRIGLFSITPPCLVDMSSARLSRLLPSERGNKKAKRQPKPLPASAPHMVCQRVGVPVSVQFRLRRPPLSAGLSDYMRYVLIRISVNKERDAGFSARPRQIHPVDQSASFGEILVIDSRKWNSTIRQLRGRDQETLDKNELLSATKTAIIDIHNRQLRQFNRQQSPRPTVNSVKYEYLTGITPDVTENRFAYPNWFFRRKKEKTCTFSPTVSKPILGPLATLRDMARAYLQELYATKRSTGLISALTYRARQNAFRYLDQFAGADLPVCQLTPYWLESFHTYLLTQAKGNADHQKAQRRLNPGTATLYCSHVNEAVHWLFKQRLIKVNPFGNFNDLDLPGYKTKEVYALEPVHIDRLLALNLPPRYQNAHFWFQLICLTGFDLPDVFQYAENRTLYETRTPGGHPKIIMKRAKPPCNECNIPISERLVDFWHETRGEVPPRIRLTTMLLHLKAIGELIGFSRRLTPKIGRKTAAMLFLNTHSVHAVSNILGHSSIQTTETYYLKVKGYHVDREIDITQPKNSPKRSQPFLQIHKIA